MAEDQEFPRRVWVEDARRDGTYFRVTWHGDDDVFVASHWEDDVCVAATRLPLSAAPELMALLTRALAERAATPLAPPEVTAAPATRPGIRERLRRKLRRRPLGEVLRFPSQPATRRDEPGATGSG